MNNEMKTAQKRVGQQLEKLSIEGLRKLEQMHDQGIINQPTLKIKMKRTI